MKKAFIIFSLLLSSCATLKSSETYGVKDPSSVITSGMEQSVLSPLKKPESSAPPRIASPEAYYHYLLANLYELENNIIRAYHEYKAALILDPKSSTLLFEVANFAVREGDLDSAEEYIQSLLEVDPDNIEAIVLLGEIYVNQNKLDQAINAYQKAIIIKPDFQESYFEIASLYMKQKKYREAEKTISRFISLQPKSPLGYYYMGRLFFEEKKSKEAVSQFKESLKQDPDYEPSWMGIGMVYEADGDSKKAISHYRKFLEVAGTNHREPRYRIIQILMQERALPEARKELEDLLKLDPNDLEANFRLSLLFSEQKEYSKSIQLLNVVIERRGNDPRLLDYLGSLYEALNDNDKAIESYQKVISADKTYSDGYIHLASVYLKMKNIDASLNVLKEAHKANPQKKDIYYSAEGWVYLQADRLDESLEAFGQAIKISPNSPAFHYNMGQAFDKKSQFEEMEKEMKKAIELEPNFVNALNYLGYSYADKNIKIKEAHDLINRALKVRPDDGFIIDSLAWVYYREGEYNKALEELTRAMKFVPDDPTIHEHLGEVYLKKVQTQQAKEEFLRSIEINPSNQKLIDRFKEAGLGDPQSEERIQKALKKLETKQAPTTNKTNQTDSHNSKI